jgi:hypothetical protein
MPFAIRGAELARTFWSESLAISPSQTEEHRRRWPHIEVDAQGRLGFHSHRDREKYLDETGFVKRSKSREY